MKNIWNIKLFRLFGIQLELHLTFFLLILFVAYHGGIEGGFSGGIWSTLIIILVFACVVLHELGHCLAAQKYGVHIHRILLLPIGGMAQFGSIPRQPRRELVIAFAGPLVNFLIVGILYLISGSPERLLDDENYYNLPDLLSLLLVFNLIMGCFNLLPVFPMDGGRVLRALLALKFTYLNATKLAVYIAKPLAIVGFFLGIFYLDNWIMAGVFAFIFLGGEIEYRMVQLRESLIGFQVRDVVSRYFLSLDVRCSVADAIALMSESPSQDILLIDERGVRGIITPDVIRKLARKKRTHEPLYDHCIHNPTILQAEWLLEEYSDLIYQVPQNIFPVLDRDILIGVIDRRNIQEAIAWKRLRLA